MNADGNILQMQRERIKIFKAQHPEDFDVTFEVDGKLIYANKYVLETISTTFKSMLSERWKSKNEVIKLDTYSFDDFYQFLTFCYAGECELSPTNISTMVDMAEFYDVALFKNVCDEYISKLECNINNIFDLMELGAKYSLAKLKAAIDKFIGRNLSMILTCDKFMDLKKSNIEKLVTFERDPGQEEKVFEAIYKWAEHQYILDEDPQKCDNRIEGIKAKMIEFLPYIKFSQMNPGYFAKFVAPKVSFTIEEYAAILCDHQTINVTVTDGYGRNLTGSFVDTCNIYDAIKSNNVGHVDYYGRTTYNWFCDIIPSVPSDLKKNKNVQQCYFVLEKNNYLYIKGSAEITDADYLLCEMEGDTSFVFDAYCRFYVSRKCFS